jgi:hypothetical protein
MNLLRYSLVTLLLTTFSLAVPAQERFSGDRECGVTDRDPWLDKYQDGLIDPTEKSLNTLFVPARFIVLGDNDGNGYIDPLKLLNSFALLNSDYAEMNIQFYIHSIDYVNRTIYWDHASFSTGQTMMIQNNVAGVINNYIVENPAGSCGYYSPGLADAMAMGRNCMGSIDRTWSHEMGHYLSLPHTFVGWEGMDIDDQDFNVPAPTMVGSRIVELADTTNCLDAADRFCDTGPDYLSNRWGCNAAGMYRDSLLDPDSTRFAVGGYNIMSYALDNCVGGFSDEQRTAMQTRMATRGLADDSGIGAVAANGAEMNLLLPEDNATLIVNDFVELVWNSVPNADYYLVQLNSSTNFNGNVLQSIITTDTTFIIEEGLQSRTNYFWKVRPFNKYVIDSDFGEQLFRFRNGRFTTSTIDAALNAAISVVPNPISAGRELLIAGRDLGESGQLTYELIDAAGRVLFSRENLTVGGAGFTERIATDKLTAGIYFLRLRLNDKLVTKRVVVTP